MQRPVTVVVLSLLTLQGCAELNKIGALVQPPRFEQAPGQRGEIRLLGPSDGRPLGGAGVRLWARVSNPNPFGLTLGTLKGTLYLEDARAADADFPLGLPLAAREDTVIPIDISFSFSDLPGLGDAARRATNRQPLAYRLDGTIGVDAGPLGQPVFGPMTLLTGEAAVPSVSGGLRPAGPLHARSNRTQQPSRVLAVGAVRMEPRPMRLRAQP
jgi:hypothetical protein